MSDLAKIPNGIWVHAHLVMKKNQKVLFKSFQKNSSKFLHLHIMLIVTRVRFHKKIPLYVAYTKWQNANSYSLVSFGHFVIVV
jgi:hypothetical protein